MRTSYDVIVVGAGTAGIFFAKRMADAGYSVGVFDLLPEERQGERLGVFHTDKERLAPFGVPEPHKGDADYITEFAVGISKSCFDHYPKRTEYPYLVLRFAPFLKRLRAWAGESGVEFCFAQRFTDFLRDGQGRICGAVFTDAQGQQAEITGRLVADCSGIPSAARRKMVNSRVETFEITPRDMFYVILHYVKFKDPEKDCFSEPPGWLYYKSWLGLTEDPEGFLFGTGANLSYEYCLACHDAFREKIPAPAYEEYTESDDGPYRPSYGVGAELGREGYWERGVTPYHRAPYSLVDDGFICMGDSACMTKPFSGEGITSGWVACDIAAQVAADAMREGAYPTEAALWAYNVRYAQGQGADFANLMATLVNAVDCSEAENEYEFSKDIVFSGTSLTRTSRNFNGDMPLPEVLGLVPKVLAGIARKGISMQSVRNLGKGILCGMRLKSLYKAYPTVPSAFAAWAAKADALWTQAGNMADVVERTDALRKKESSSIA
ncbi:MAG: NAD(P)/FAD-dependent oxidoreductase [Oscillospiraceae bacterium]|jgi:flavin-dependent dehydrogenase|nr:NAD(P)/FAD-dependent oxidoreductase [Oscillospiraceae bacterium]